ncbi:MAG: NUDIX domain-containing protein [Caldilinea sp.]|nr:NUDIX domain-containing protein [Caldilinea sp.]MDW8440339.1 NUDIX domain-containing protein [Caldilineaceae bacterium]
MNVSEQGAREFGARHLVVPRVLVFLTSVNPTNGAHEVLLLKGAPTKRLWANKYNGLGGHVEPTEDVYTAAVREVWEEAGIEVRALSLRGVVTIDAGFDEFGRRPGILMFVFVGETTERTVWPSAEGTLAWVAVDALADYPLVDDLVELLPRALEGSFFFGHYSSQPDGTLRYAFRSSNVDSSAS